MRGELRVVSGKYSGKAMTIMPGEKIIIGRASASDLQLNTEGVSRKHAVITATEAAIELSDLSSRNGVSVNGDRARKTTPLKDGDQIEIGRNLIVFIELGEVPRDELAPSVTDTAAMPPPEQGSQAVIDAIDDASAAARGAEDDDPTQRAPDPHLSDGLGTPAMKTGAPASRVVPPVASGPFGDGEPSEAEVPAIAEQPTLVKAPAGEAPPARHDQTSEVPSLAERPSEDPLVAAVMARKLGPFVLEKKLGRGGVGIVFRATDTRRDMKVALKVLKTEKASKASHAERFRQECAVLSMLDHPGIVRCVDHGRTGDLMYLAMEYAEGDTLESVRKLRGDRVPMGEALDWTDQILRALEYIHGQNVIHRDIKPANAILMADTRIKLVDFGLGRLTDVTTESGRLTVDSIAMGTRHFMPPEQIRDTAGVDHRADLYAVAAMLFMFVSGDLPFPKEGGMMAEVKAILNDAPRRLREVYADAPLSLEKLIERGLAKEPDDRFQSAKEMRAALDLVWR